MPLEGMHRDHDRALSFGSIADRYERFRPGYPQELFADLLSSHPKDALDVGCGTGKVAVALAKRGVRVLGVEPDPRMATVALRRGVTVEIDTFEDWNDEGRRFDLLTGGHAWHWIDPDQGVAKASRLLRRGGAIARFWNYHAIAPRLLVDFEAIYRELAPGAQVIGRDPTALPDAADPFAVSPTFTDVDRRTYRWTRWMSAEEWSNLIGTFGDHIRLGEQRLASLQDALSAAVQRYGGSIEIRGGTYLLYARRAD